MSEDQHQHPRERLAADLFAARQDYLVINGRQTEPRQWADMPDAAKRPWIEEADAILERLEALDDW